MVNFSVPGNLKVKDHSAFEHLEESERRLEKGLWDQWHMETAYSAVQSRVNHISHYQAG